MSAGEPFEYVRLESGVLTVAVATNAAGNSIDLSATEEIVKALADPAVRSVLLVGGDANFCAGGNVKQMAAAGDPGAFLFEIAELFHRICKALDAVQVPVVAAVNGWAAGAGMSLVCTADVSVGGPGTRLRPGYPGLGFSPDGGLSWSLPRVVGLGRAREILMRDRSLDAAEAVDLGLISYLVDSDDDVRAEAEKVAARFAAGPTTAYQRIKTLLKAGDTGSLGDQLDAESRSISAAAASPTGREGVAAFVGKRRPEFTGLE